MKLQLLISAPCRASRTDHTLPGRHRGTGTRYLNFAADVTSGVDVSSCISTSSRQLLEMPSFFSFFMPPASENYKPLGADDQVEAVQIEARLASCFAALSLNPLVRISHNFYPVSSHEVYRCQYR